MNDDALYIRCPTCRTVFRTQGWTLDLQVGKVRCGQCRMVFNGRSNLVEVAFDDVAADAEASPSPLHGAQHSRESDEAASATTRELEREVDEQAAAFEREAMDRPNALIGTQPEEFHPPSTAYDAEDPVRAEPAFGTTDLDSPSSTRAAPSFDDELHRPIATDALDDTAPATMTGPAPATPRTPFPAIGIDHDPLGMDAMPKARGAHTITGADSGSTTRDPGPATRSRFSLHGNAAAEALAGNTLARYGPTSPGALTPADPVLRHDAVVMPDWKTPTPPPRRAARALYSVLSVLLFVGLVAQALFHYRNVIAADYPVTRQHLVAACTTIGCRIEPLRNRDEIVIESHDLQADPAHQGLLILQTTLRNQSRHSLAFPHLELELADNVGKPIVRRVFTPIDYAGGAADFTTGIPGNSEWNVKLFLDASSVTAGAYHLYHFYP